MIPLWLAWAALAGPCAGQEPVACAESGVERILAGDPTGLELVRDACAQGAPLACYRLGSALLDAPGIAPDPPAAAAALRTACDAEQAEACADLGQLFVRGTGVSNDPPTARRLVQRSCDLGFLRACGEVGGMWVGGYGGPADPSNGRALAVKGCEGTLHGPTCERAAALLAEGVGGPTDVAGARRLQAKACTAGHPTSCSVVATHLHQAGDSNSARELATRGCALDAGDSCVLVGILELRGLGGAEDPRSALLHLVRGCDAGHARACQAAGALLAEGKRVPLDTARSSELLARACTLDPGLCP
ncbi:MAG: TPR repeat protein [Myxococcota bacterium]|jgi:TPR repeat protein